jgi:hypothetical protein
MVIKFIFLKKYVKTMRNSTKRKKIGKIRVFILTSADPKKKLEFTPLEEWLKTIDKRTVYHFVYLIRLKALEHAHVDIETRKPPVKGEKK